MGKGQRNKIKAATFAANNKNKSEARKKLITIVSVILVVVIIGGLVGYYIYANNGGFLRSSIAMTSEHFEVNGAMMSYFFNITRNQQISQYGYYFQYMGLDTSKSLKTQTYSGQTTWFDYFMSSAKQSVKNVLLLCEAATANNCKLDDDDRNDIENELKELKAAAKEAGYTEAYYVQAMFGVGVKTSDVKDCLELSTLASKYYDKLMDSYVYDDEAKETYFGEHKKDYTYVDYLTYSFDFTPESGEKNDDGKYDKDEANYSNIQTYADALALCLSADDFKAYVENYLKTVTYAGYTILSDTDTASTAEDAKEVKQSSIDTTVNATVKTQAAYSDTETLNWAFDEARVKDETNIIKSFDETTNKYTLTVVVLNTTAYRLDYETINVRHILFGVDTYGSYETAELAKAKAEEIKTEFLAGAKTEDSFDVLAKQYNDDSSSLYENVTKGMMVESFNDWCFDENRQVGDCDVVETTYGAHLMYFVGTGDEAWKISVNEDMIADAYDKDMTQFSKDYTIKTDAGVLESIEA